MSNEKQSCVPPRFRYGFPRHPYFLLVFIFFRGILIKKAVVPGQTAVYIDRSASLHIPGDHRLRLGDRLFGLQYMTVIPRDAERNQ